VTLRPGPAAPTARPSGVGKEGLHDGRVLHNRDDLQPAATAGTGEDIDISEPSRIASALATKRVATDLATLAEHCRYCSGACLTDREITDPVPSLFHDHDRTACEGVQGPGQHGHNVSFEACRSSFAWRPVDSRTHPWWADVPRASAIGLPS
jgi:hypothetical protein